MRADGQERDARRLVDRQAARRMEIALRHGDPLAHAAVAMHAEHRDPDAATGPGDAGLGFDNHDQDIVTRLRE